MLGDESGKSGSVDNVSESLVPYNRIQMFVLNLIIYTWKWIYGV